MPDGGCCTCEAMMCDGEDRVVDVKKKGEVRVGERRCYKGQCVSEKCTNGYPIRRPNRVRNVSCRDFFEVECREEVGRGLCWELRATVVLKALPLPSLLRCPMLPIAGARIG
jgi:hypothetical protein